MAEVFVAGALHLDVVVDAPRLPEPDETVMGHSVAYRFGGKGGNQAVAAARMGARTAMAGRVGKDRFGEQLLARLDAAGVDRTQVRTTAGSSGMSAAIVDDAGDYGAVVVSGVNAEIGADEIELPRRAQLLLLQNEIPEAVNAALAAQASAAAKVVLNAAPARPTASELLRRTDVVVVNRLEAEAMTGASLADGETDKALDALVALGPRAAIVTLGAGGLVAATRQGERFALPAHEVQVVSTHGAGDTFVGALAAELSRGRSLQDASVFANAAAALAVTTPPDSRDKIGPGDVRALAAQIPRP